MKIFHGWNKNASNFHTEQNNKLALVGLKNQADANFICILIFYFSFRFGFQLACLDQFFTFVSPLFDTQYNLLFFKEKNNLCTQIYFTQHTHTHAYYAILYTILYLRNYDLSETFF